MEKKLKKAYEKALSLYNNGELNKALKCCEDGISNDLKNSDLLNLKGLILYVKGDLKGAVSIWKINKACNSDIMSDSYIKDSIEDKRRLELFQKAQKLIKNLHIDEAIELLELCLESDFNSIQVNNSLSICYLKRGEVDKCRLYLNKALSIDKTDKVSLSILKDLGIYKDVKEPKYRKVITFVIILAIILGGASVFVFKNLNKSKENIAENVGKQEEQQEKVEVKTEEKPEEKLQKNIENEKLDKVEDNSEKQNDGVIAEEVPLTLDEVGNFYIDATTKFGEGNYQVAKELLNKAIKYSDKSYLNDDILFLLASTEEKLGNVDNSIKNFEKYISLYENGDYIEETCYKLALLYKDKDKEKSKIYAYKLVYNHPESIYNNDNIDSILKN